MSNRVLFNLEVEARILYTFMQSPLNINNCLDILSPEIFYSSFNRDVCQALMDLNAKGSDVDIVSIHSYNENLTLIDLGKIVMYEPYFTGLHGKVKYIYELYMLRELSSLGSEITQMANSLNQDPFELNHHIGLKLMKIIPKIGEGSQLLRDYLPIFTKKLEENQQNGGKKGVMSGIWAVDKHTNGFQKGDLVILAARPSVGKTAFALNIIGDMIFNQKLSVGMFSLEMDKDQLIERLMSTESAIQLKKMRHGGLTTYDWTKYNKISNFACSDIVGNLAINDIATINIFGIKAEAMAFKNKYNIDVLVVDYIQLISAPKKNTKDTNRVAELSQISRELKILAKELKIPIVALAQLNREVEKRSDPKPTLADIKDCGAIEQDADTVIFLYRPNGNDYESTVEVNALCAKQRQGSLFNESLTYVKEILKFVDPNQSAPITETFVDVSTIPQNKRNDNFIDTPF